jgi:hypothetical protein
VGGQEGVGKQVIQQKAESSGQAFSCIRSQPLGILKHPSLQILEKLSVCFY